jgi:alkylhydroperoxidase family enzyme
VTGALADIETCALPEAEKALLRFVVKVNAEAHAIGEADVAAVKATGWTDEAIYDGIMVCALFNFYNRWIDANGVGGCPDPLYRESGRRLASGGYTREET